MPENTPQVCGLPRLFIYVIEYKDYAGKDFDSETGRETKPCDSPGPGPCDACQKSEPRIVIVERKWI